MVIEAGRVRAVRQDEGCTAQGRQSAFRIVGCLVAEHDHEPLFHDGDGFDVVSKDGQTHKPNVDLW